MVRLHGNTYTCTIHPRSPIGLLVGVELVLYFQTMRRLLAHAGARAKSDVFYAIFSSAMLLISTIWVSVQTIFCGKMWLQDLGSSGLDAFWAENDSSWYMDLGSMSLVVLQFMTDGLMVWYTQWQLFILTDGSRSTAVGQCGTVIALSYYPRFCGQQHLVCTIPSDARLTC